MVGACLVTRLTQARAAHSSSAGLGCLFGGAVLVALKDVATGVAASSGNRALGIAGPNLTFHLSHMRQAGLVSSRRAGRNVIYAADFGRMTDLIGYLQDNCCEGVAPSATSVGIPRV